MVTHLHLRIRSYWQPGDPSFLSPQMEHHGNLLQQHYLVTPPPGRILENIRLPQRPSWTRQPVSGYRTRKIFLPDQCFDFQGSNLCDWTYLVGIWCCRVWDLERGT